MNIKRISTTVIGIPLVGLILAFGNKYVIDIAISIIAFMSIYEFYKSFKGKHKPVEWVGYISALLIAFTHLIDPKMGIHIIAITIPLIIFLLFLKVILSNMKTTVVDVAITIFGICYIVVFLWFLPIIRQMENGGLLLGTVFIIAWGTDIVAYIVGKTLGKHKFTQISPNKTIEGCIGGIIGAVIGMLIYTYICNNFFQIDWNYGVIILLSIILSIVGQIGDLAESCIKRYTGVKDSGNLLPGHGGMLDRIDSIIFIAPFAYIFFTYIL